MTEYTERARQITSLTRFVGGFSNAGKGPVVVASLVLLALLAGIDGTSRGCSRLIALSRLPTRKCRTRKRHAAEAGQRAVAGGAQRESPAPPEAYRSYL